MRLRPFCPTHCRVVDVQYVIANDGTDHTLAQLTLSFSDEASPLKVRRGEACGSPQLGMCACGVAARVEQSFSDEAS